MVPLKLEDFMRSGISNLGAAQIHEIGTEHNHGPCGDRELARKRRVG
jgi:hypothetical protein